MMFGDTLPHAGIVCRVRAGLRATRVVAAIAAAGALAAEVACADVRIVGLRVDGRNVAIRPAAAAADPAAVRVPAGADRIDIVVEGNAAAEDGPETARGIDDLPPLQGSRLRYRLDGHDDDWQDPPAYGRLQISFADAVGKGVGSAEARMPGTSPGWRGGPERSPLKAYASSCTAPPLAARVRINFLSVDAETAVGELGIDDVSLTITAATGEERVQSLPLEGLEPMPHPLATPRGWGRSGTRDQMSRVALREETGRPMLVILDDAADAYGSWIFYEGVAVQPGEKVTVSWRACHTFGRSERIEAAYPRLPAGTYWLRAGAFLPGGQPTGSEATLQLLVERPWYGRPEAWVAAVAGGLVAAAFTARAMSLRRMRRQLDNVERAHALERERARIARDLHDDIGAGLTEIAMQTDWVRRDLAGLASPDTVARAERVCTSAIDLVRSVDAIVWAVNPANDTLDRFVPYLTHAIEQFLDAAGIGMRFDLPDHVPREPLAGTVRHALFLVVREAINNVVKHAHARIVRLGLRLDESPRQLVITIEDDGCGVPPGVAHATETGRSGLANMRRRIEELGGRFTISALAEGGTRIECVVPRKAG